MPDPRNSGDQDLNHVTYINTSLIVEFLLSDTDTKEFARAKIFSKLKDIHNFNTANLIFTILEKMHPFSDNEKNLIINEYESNDQISHAYSTRLLYKKLKGTQ